MFGKLFGRSRKTIVLDSGLPAVTATPVEPQAVVTPAPVTPAPVTPAITNTGVDLNALLHTVQEARAHSGGDPMKLATELQQKFGGANVVTMGNPFGQPDVVGQLERLAKLHAEGALTDAEFAAEKAKLIGTPPPPAA